MNVIAHMSYRPISNIVHHSDFDNKPICGVKTGKRNRWTKYMITNKEINCKRCLNMIKGR